MHRDLLSALVANVRKRAAEGDCPVTPAYPVEALENAIIDLAKHEAPAEGAGEDAAWMWLNGHVECDPADRDYSADEMVDAFMAGQSAALRARSSAPEAREGEAVGQVNALYASGFGRMRCIEWAAGDMPEVGTKLYIHPAAPSADKLRIAVEALETVAYGDGGIGTHRAITQKALAALKAEGKS